MNGVPDNATDSNVGYSAVVFLVSELSYMSTQEFGSFYSARNARIASALLAIAIPSVRLSVCLSVRPSHASIVSKRRHVARCSLHRWIAKCV